MVGFNNELEAIGMRYFIMESFNLFSYSLSTKLSLHEYCISLCRHIFWV